MAKNDVKMYVLSRLTTLLRELKSHKTESDKKEKLEERIDEVKNIASNFGVKTKEIEKLEAEILA